MRLVQERRPVAPLIRRPAVRAALTAAAVVVALDQFTKSLVTARLGSDDQIRLLFGVRIVHVSNRGMAFSVGNGGSAWRVAVISLVLLVVLASVVRRELRRPLDDPRAPSVAQGLTFGVLFGGALGNVIDRIVRSPGWGRGAVVDFVDVRFWPVFNVADAALTCGCIALAVITLRRSADTDDVRDVARCRR